MDMQISKLTPYLSAIKDAVRSDLPIYGLALTYVIAGYFYLSSLGLSALGTLQIYIWSWSINFGVVGPYTIAVLAIISVTRRCSQRRRLAYWSLLSPRRVSRLLAGLLLLLTAMLLFTSMFSSIKASFPMAAGFRFDTVQADLDEALHFGVAPWHLLYAVAQHPWVLSIVEFNYNILWFIVCYSTLFWMATSRRADGVRNRYLLSWMSVWIVIGTIMASTWLSAGPAFYGLVTGDTARFGDQIAFLATSQGSFSSAHSFQAYLWALYASGQPGVGSGISAFPSMHIGLITLNALFAGELSRRLAALMWVYVAFVLLSSVYLGWHYAIDGYVSILVTLALYWAFRLLPALLRSALEATSNQTASAA